jgi:glycosyltransferase involved in cell wall biosynthesis
MEAESDVPIIVANTQSELCHRIHEFRPDFVVTDDDLSRLRLLRSLKHSESKVVAFVQVLYGSHAIVSSFDLHSLPIKEKVRYKTLKLVPFSALLGRYVNLLRGCNIILANSKTTATFLRILYDVDLSGVVYPPVDIDVFKPTCSNKNPDEIILYLGSHSGDTREDIAEAIVQTTLSSDHTINLLGDPNLALRLMRKHDNLVFHRNLTDDELADLYSKNAVTICPQKWETFGYVPVESMACGTPVLAPNCMGAQETIINAETGLLANSQAELLKLLERMLTASAGAFPQADLRNHVAKNFSIETSTNQLMKILTDVERT